MHIFLSYLGCRLNQAELELWARQFNQAGHVIVSTADQADLMVLNSCAVTQEAVRKSRKNIKQLKRRNPQARIVVSGCFVSLQDEAGNKETAEALAVDLVVHNSDKQALVNQACLLLESSGADPNQQDPDETITTYSISEQSRNAGLCRTDTPLTPPFPGNGIEQRNGVESSGQLPARWIPLKPVSEKRAASTVDNNSAGLSPPAESKSRRRQRAFVKIQDGCRYRCTYCVVTLARGDEVSRPIAELVDEVNLLITEGVKEIVLTGVHVGGYGSDTGESLATLLRALLSDTDVPRIRFASVEPWDLEDDLLTCLQNSRVMPHMHLPLQSGSDSVLKRMARRCKTADFKRLVNDLQTSIAGFNVTTDVIVGFPGETDSEWQETLDFVNTIAFGHIHVFPFSIRAGTKAARLPNQLTGDIKKLRVRQLRELGLKQRHDFLEGCIGQNVDVLWEKLTPQATDPEGPAGSLNATNQYERARIQGLTPNYIKVFADLPAAAAAQQNWVNKITAATLNHLQTIPGKSANELQDYLIEARVAAAALPKNMRSKDFATIPQL